MESPFDDFSRHGDRKSYGPAVHGNPDVMCYVKEVIWTCCQSQGDPDVMCYVKEVIWTCCPWRPGPFGTPRNCTSCLVHLLSAIARRPPYWNYLCHMICGGQNGGRQHAGPFGSPRNIRLTSEVSVPCTYQSFGSPRKFPFRARGTK